MLWLLPPWGHFFYKNNEFFNQKRCSLDSVMTSENPSTYFTQNRNIAHYHFSLFNPYFIKSVHALIRFDLHGFGVSLQYFIYFSVLTLTRRESQNLPGGSLRILNQAGGGGQMAHRRKKTLSAIFFYSKRQKKYQGTLRTQEPSPARAL